MVLAPSRSSYSRALRARDIGADLGRGLLLFGVLRTLHGAESVLCFIDSPLNLVPMGARGILVRNCRKPVGIHHSSRRRATGTVACWHDLSTHCQPTA